MQVYKCDACGRIMEDIHSEKMKEFFYESEYGLLYVLPRKAKRIKKIQICDDCFHNLNSIQQNKYHGGDKNA